MRWLAICKFAFVSTRYKKNLRLLTQMQKCKILLIRFIGIFIWSTFCYKITESFMLEKTSEVIELNLWRSIILSIRPWH